MINRIPNKISKIEVISLFIKTFMYLLRLHHRRNHLQVPCLVAHL